MTEPISDVPGAVSEAAKAAGKAIDAAREFGGFISKYVSGPLEQGMGIFEDKLKYMRWERQTRLMQRAQQRMEELGFSRPTEPIPLKLAIPLLEAASLEDDDYLQDLWVRLLVGAATGTSAQTLTRAHIAILEQLSHADVEVLFKIQEVPFEEGVHAGVLTHELPVRAYTDPRTARDELDEPSIAVRLSLANLARVGCVSLGRTFGGGELYSRVHPTFLALSLRASLTLPPAR